jgi:hypothetical protein
MRILRWNLPFIQQRLAFDLSDPALRRVSLCAVESADLNRHALFTARLAPRDHQVLSSPQFHQTPPTGHHPCL